MKIEQLYLPGKFTLDRRQPPELTDSELEKISFEKSEGVDILTQLVFGHSPGTYSGVGLTMKELTDGIKLFRVICALERMGRIGMIKLDSPQVFDPNHKCKIQINFDNPISKKLIQEFKQNEKGK
jgi:hypothetical protein